MIYVFRWGDRRVTDLVIGAVEDVLYGARGGTETAAEVHRHRAQLIGRLHRVEVNHHLAAGRPVRHYAWQPAADGESHNPHLRHVIGVTQSD